MFLPKIPGCILLLDKNDVLYRKYFEWEKNFEVINRPMYGWCDLCEKLNDPTQKNKSYENVACQMVV